jgi:hypothetical protein
MVIQYITIVWLSELLFSSVHIISFFKFWFIHIINRNFFTIMNKRTCIFVKLVQNQEIRNTSQLPDSNELSSINNKESNLKLYRHIIVCIYQLMNPNTGRITKSQTSINEKKGRQISQNCELQQGYKNLFLF